MEKVKTNVSKVPGVIIIGCALGMMILNLVLGKNIDSFLVPFYFLMLGIFFLSRKQSEVTKQPVMSPPKRKLFIAALSISLVAGIVTFIFTLV